MHMGKIENENFEIIKIAMHASLRIVSNNLTIASVSVNTCADSRMLVFCLK